MLKLVYKIVIAIVVVTFAYYCFLYFVPYSEGMRSGYLVKFSKKGFIIKTWEGELSQGVSDEQHFEFSVQRSDKEVIDALQKLQGENVNLSYEERYKSFFWLGDTQYFIKKVERSEEPTK